MSHSVFAAQVNPERLGWISSHLEAGELRVELEDALPLEEAAEAHRRSEEGHTRGKIVLKTT
ncbi:MAG: zinc-binding dehydrogenase [Rubrobacter sp.]